MSKEQLEEIENRVFSRTFHTGIGVDMITIPERDYIYLKKQAERVRELGVSCQAWQKRLDASEAQNKRYREVKEKLNLMISKEGYDYPDRYIVGYLDGLIRAVGLLEALESESDGS